MTDTINKFQLKRQDLGFTGWETVKGSEKTFDEQKGTSLPLGDDFFTGRHKYLEITPNADGGMDLSIEASSRLRPDPIVKKSSKLKPETDTATIKDGFATRYVLTKVN